tara:strand:- start:43209 stop:43919 length:711 start_codon:yes stop_codon:yes gene_type:complete
MWTRFPADDPTDGLVQWVSDHGGDNRSTWCVDARGGSRGISLLRGSIDGADSSARDSYFSFQPVGRDSLPVLAEQFIRGDELHLWYPQREGSFALRLMLQPILANEDFFVLEAVLSIETDLLDSHPMIDVVVPAIDVKRFASDGATASEGVSPISVCRQQDDCVATLLGPHDRPFTRDQSGVGHLQLRLFGDFLEKGVIRKARPWLVVQRGQTEMDASGLSQRWNELSESPLPLTP